MGRRIIDNGQYDIQTVGQHITKDTKQLLIIKMSKFEGKIMDQRTTDSRETENGLSTRDSWLMDRTVDRRTTDNGEKDDGQWRGGGQQTMERRRITDNGEQYKGQ